VAAVVVVVDIVADSAVEGGSGKSSVEIDPAPEASGEGDCYKKPSS
jgi:hypothetical protein